MLPLVLFIALGIFILVMFEYRARKNSNSEVNRILSGNECCGQHVVCEKEMKQKWGTDIVYFDDEELDELKGIAPEAYTAQQIEIITEVFHTLKNNEIQAWLHSLQLRNIELPASLREEVLLTLKDTLIK